VARADSLPSDDVWYSKLPLASKMPLPIGRAVSVSRISAAAGTEAPVAAGSHRRPASHVLRAI
jgi:hypothetical protein